MTRALVPGAAVLRQMTQSLAAYVEHVLAVFGEHLAVRGPVLVGWTGGVWTGLGEGGRPCRDRYEHIRVVKKIFFEKFWELGYLSTIYIYSEGPGGRFETPKALVLSFALRLQIIH